MNEIEKKRKISSFSNCLMRKERGYVGECLAQGGRGEKEPDA